MKSDHKIDQKELQEKYIEYRFLLERVKQLQQQLQTVNQQLIEIMSTKQSIDEFYRIINHLKLTLKDEIIICEVGGGYGRLAYIFLSMMPRCRYILVDLPNTLIVAHYYFSNIMKSKIMPYNESRQKKITRTHYTG